MKRRLLAVGVATALAAAAVLAVLAWRAPGGERGAPDEHLAGLRSAAALEPCPRGVGPAFPRLTLACLGGGPDVRLRDPGPGVPTLVNVWGTWCPPCVEEVPLLVRFRERAAGKVQVLGVLTEDAPDQGLEFARRFGVHYPNVVDPDGRVLRAFPPGPPVTLFVDARGAVVYRHSGRLTSQAQLDGLVARHLGVRL